MNITTFKLLTVFKYLSHADFFSSSLHPFSSFPFFRKWTSGLIFYFYFFNYIYPTAGDFFFPLSPPITHVTESLDMPFWQADILYHSWKHLHSYPVIPLSWSREGKNLSKPSRSSSAEVRMLPFDIHKERREMKRLLMAYEHGLRMESAAWALLISPTSRWGWVNASLLHVIRTQVFGWCVYMLALLP